MRIVDGQIYSFFGKILRGLFFFVFTNSATPIRVKKKFYYALKNLFQLASILATNLAIIFLHKIILNNT